MQEIGNKLIEIRVTDSNLTAPGAGTGFLNDLGSGLGGIVDGLVATPALLVVLIALAVAVPLSILAIVLSRLHHKRTNRTSAASRTILKATPIAATLAIVAAPLLTLAAPSPLDNTPVTITIDKATALSATDTTTVSLNQDATSHVDIYAQLDNDFNGYLNTDLTVGAANTNDSTPATYLSTTNDLIYTTGPAVAGDTTNFDITVAITENLPVGDYVGQVSFYGDFVQKETATVTFWCQASYGNAKVTMDSQLASDVSSYDMSGIMSNGDDVGRAITFNIGDSYELPTPNELELEGAYCDNEGDNMYWRGWTVANGQLVWDIMYPNLGDTIDIVASPVDKEPIPSGEVWYEQCWKNWNYDGDFCPQYNQEISAFAEIWDAWEYQYNSFGWSNWIDEYYNEHGAYPVVDGMAFKWSMRIDQN